MHVVLGRVLGILVQTSDHSEGVFGFGLERISWEGWHADVRGILAVFLGWRVYCI